LVAFTNNATVSSATTLDSQTLITANANSASSASNSSTSASNASSSATSATTSASTPTQAGEIYIAGNTSLNTAAQIQANADNGGLIILSSPAGTYQNTGYIQTNGGAGLGGTIAQSGLISTTLTGATLEANGTTGGGNIITGRDFKTNPLAGSATLSASLPFLNTVISLPTTAITAIDVGTTLTANATASGNGGSLSGCNSGWLRRRRWIRRRAEWRI
jgi:hypothetical protein